MTIFDLNYEQLNLLSAAIAGSIGENYNIDQLNILGNFFQAVGTNITLIAASKDIHEKQSKNIIID